MNSLIKHLKMHQYNVYYFGALYKDMVTEHGNKTRVSGQVLECSPLWCGE